MFSKEEVREAIIKSRKIIKMLQGTMGLEGQGLSKETLRLFKKQTIKELLFKKLIL